MIQPTTRPRRALRPLLAPAALLLAAPALSQGEDPAAPGDLRAEKERIEALVERERSVDTDERKRLVQYVRGQLELGQYDAIERLGAGAVGPLRTIALDAALDELAQLPQNPVRLIAAQSTAEAIAALEAALDADPRRYELLAESTYCLGQLLWEASRFPGFKDDLARLVERSLRSERIRSTVRELHALLAVSRGVRTPAIDEVALRSKRLFSFDTLKEEQRYRLAEAWVERNGTAYPGREEFTGPIALVSNPSLAPEYARAKIWGLRKAVVDNVKSDWGPWGETTAVDLITELIDDTSEEIRLDAARRALDLDLERLRPLGGALDEQTIRRWRRIFRRYDDRQGFWRDRAQRIVRGLAVDMPADVRGACPGLVTFLTDVVAESSRETVAEILDLVDDREWPSAVVLSFLTASVVRGEINQGECLSAVRQRARELSGAARDAFLSQALSITPDSVDLWRDRFRPETGPLTKAEIAALIGVLDPVTQNTSRLMDEAARRAPGWARAADTLRTIADDRSVTTPRRVFAAMLLAETGTCTDADLELLAEVHGAGDRDAIDGDHVRERIGNYNRDARPSERAKKWLDRGALLALEKSLEARSPLGSLSLDDIDAPELDDPNRILTLATSAREAGVFERFVTTNAHWLANGLEDMSEREASVELIVPILSRRPYDHVVEFARREGKLDDAVVALCDLVRSGEGYSKRAVDKLLALPEVSEFYLSTVVEAARASANAEVIAHLNTQLRVLSELRELENRLNDPESSARSRIRSRLSAIVDGDTSAPEWRTSVYALARMGHPSDFDRFRQLVARLTEEGDESTGSALFRLYLEAATGAKAD
ncbi:MAG: hypothetical protein AAFU73_14255 [Planctomycetota bacterium]